jgi:hypothetical protein
MIKELFNIFMRNQEEIVTAVIIMVSAVIVFMGILKAVLFNRIKNKCVRSVALSFSSVALMYATVAVYFVINTVDFKWFLPCGTLVSIAMIVTYWMYENTQLRTGIHKIGSFVITKLFNKIVSKVNDVASGTELIGNAIDGMLKNGTAKTSETNEKNKELKNL